MLEELLIGDYRVSLAEHGATCSGTVTLNGQAVFSEEGAKSRTELLEALASQAFGVSNDAYSLAIGLLAGTASKGNFANG